MIYRFSANRRRLLLILAAVVIAATVFSLPMVQLESNVMAFLPNDSQTTQDYRFARDRLTGIYSVEVVIDTPSGWMDEEIWPALETFARNMEAAPGVSRVVSPLDLLKKLNQWEQGTDPQFYTLPRDAEAAQNLLEQLDSSGDGLLKGRIQGNRVRLSILIKEVDATRIRGLAAKAEEELERLPNPLKGYVTSQILRALDEQLTLVDTQVRSFGLAFASVFLCILIGIKSWKLTLLSLLPNLMPILCVFGTMVLFDVTLNPVTVMVASVALGISVDDAVHTLNAFKSYGREGRSPQDAIDSALNKVGPSIVMTTVTACIGFFAMARSFFVPIRFFGLLSGLAMLVALCCNLFLVPAIVVHLSPARRGTSGPRKVQDRNGPLSQ